MDLELFVARCQRDRGWSEEQALQQWSLLRADEGIARDNGGPANFPLRLSIPPWVFGDEGVQRAEGEYEQKTVNLSSRAAAASTDAVRQMKEEIKHGFARPGDMQADINELSSSMHTSLPLGSLTAEDFDSKARKESSIAALLENHAPAISLGVGGQSKKPLPSAQPSSESLVPPSVIALTSGSAGDPA